MGHAPRATAIDASGGHADRARAGRPAVARAAAPGGQRAGAELGQPDQDAHSVGVGRTAPWALGGRETRAGAISYFASSRARSRALGDLPAGVPGAAPTGWAL